MKISYEAKDGTVEKEWELSKMQEDFYKTNVRFPLLSGGFGCLPARTIIATPSGTTTMGKVKVGDVIWGVYYGGRSIPTTVIRKIDSGKKQVYRIITELGFYIDGSEEHEYLVDSGDPDRNELWSVRKIIDYLDGGGKNIRLIKFDSYHPITKYEKLGIENVYDITVNCISHMFYANDFIVSNSGKTLILCHKIMQHLSYPGNYGLLGRLTYQELQDSTQQTFFEVCPPNMIQSYSRSEQRLYLKNGSQLIFRHLDTVSENEIKSLNLGFAAIDQVEEIPEAVFHGLRGRLRRKVETAPGEPKYVHQIMMTCNPALFWGYRVYKQESDPDYHVFESSTLDNAKHLGQEYIDNLLKGSTETWKRQYVYGIWDETTFTAQGAYFPVEYIQEQNLLKNKPIRVTEGITIFKEMDTQDEYQMGIDPSEGVVDPSGIVVVSKATGEVVAVWTDRLPADKLASKITQIGRMYRNAKANIEVNAAGMATLTKLRDAGYSNIYKREVFDSVSRKKIEKYGWKTTHANKQTLLDSFLQKMRENKAKLNDERIISELRTFVYTEDASKNGFGAVTGYHDDLIMATALAYWGLKGEYTVSVDPSYIPRNSVPGTLAEIQSRRSKYISK